MSDKYMVTDLLKHSVEQKPLEFASTFNDILLDKLQVAVANKKEEIAQKMFNSNDITEPEYEEDNKEDLDA